LIRLALRIRAGADWLSISRCGDAGGLQMGWLCTLNSHGMKFDVFGVTVTLYS